MKRLFALLPLLLSFLLLCNVSSANDEGIAQIGYSFRSENSGGIAIAEVDAKTGKISDARILFESAECKQPVKVRRTEQDELVVTNIDEDNPSVFIAGGGQQVRQVALKSVPDGIQIIGNQGIVTCAKDLVVVFNVERAKITTSWDVGKLYRPRANGPEGIFATPDKKHVVISFQKDDKSGKEYGNRLAVYALPKMLQVGDLQLPRNRKNLHIEGNKKEQGPGPEVVNVFGDTLAVTLDLYGAVGFMDWSAAKKGEIANWSMVSTDIDGNWGVAFPDRVCPIRFGSHETLLVCNAGSVGGAVLISMERRKILWKRPVPAGLERPVYFPQQKRAYSVCSGKTKQRQVDAVKKEYFPKSSLYAFDFSSSDAIATAPVEERPLVDKYAIKIARVGPSSPILLIAIGSDTNEANELITYDTEQQKMLDRKPTAGLLQRFES